MSERQTKAGNQITLSLSLTISLFLTLTLSHSHIISISHSLTLDMLNKFCFHVYAQNSMIIGENGNDFFLTPSAPSPVT